MMKKSEELEVWRWLRSYMNDRQLISHDRTGPTSWEKAHSLVHARIAQLAADEEVAVTWTRANWEKLGGFFVAWLAGPRIDEHLSEFVRILNKILDKPGEPN